MTATVNIIPIVGNLTADPELKHLTDGTAVVNFSVGSTSSRFDRTTNAFVDEPAVFYRLAAWRKDAENLAASAKKGTRVVIIAKVKTNSYTTKEGSEINALEFEVQEIAVSLAYSTVVATRNPKDDARTANQVAPAQYSAPAEQQAPVQQPVAAAAPAASADDFS